MDDEAIARVRDFNRIVGRRVGALNDRSLARRRSLGEARVLWEVGDGGRDVRALRAALELDSGYLSRLLRALEGEGLLVVDRHESDGRVRTAHLTSAGSAEVAKLDRIGDSVAASFLEPLNASQRDRLVTAMGDVRRLLTAAMVEVAPIDPDHGDARHCLREYGTEVVERVGDGSSPVHSIPVPDHDLRPPNGDLVLARLHAQPVGCGALSFREGEPPHIERMWVAPSTRGLGVGRRLLAELEQRAAATGSGTVRLEANGALTEAIGLCRSAGYAEVGPDQQRHAHHRFEKRLG